MRQKRGESEDPPLYVISLSIAYAAGATPRFNTLNVRKYGLRASVPVPVPGANGLATKPYRVLNPIFGWNVSASVALTIVRGTYGQ